MTHFKYPLTHYGLATPYGVKDLSPSAHVLACWLTTPRDDQNHVDFNDLIDFALMEVNTTEPTQDITHWLVLRN